MRTIFRTSLVAVAGLALSAAPAAAQGKIGYVNTQAVLAQTPAMATAQNELTQRAAPYSAEIQQMDSTLKALVAVAAADTGASRGARAREIQERQATYEQRIQSLQDSLAGHEQRLLGPIMQHLERSLEQVRVEGGYSMIFDVARGTVIVAADTTLDVTAQVIEKMRTIPTAAASPAPRGTGPVAAPAGVTSRPPRSPNR